MKKTFRVIVFFCGVFSLLALAAYAQDESSLADIARQTRQQKQKDVPGKDAPDKVAAAAKTPRVITNDEIPEHSGPDPLPSSEKQEMNNSQPAYSGGKQPAEAWKSQILSVKSEISSLQSNIERINGSVRFTSGNCVSNCVQWNERQQQKQQQVEQMKAQLDEQKKHLEEMQESARRQGYGSSVYEP